VYIPGCSRDHFGWRRQLRFAAPHRGGGACRRGGRRAAKFKIAQVVRHRLYPFRGVIFDVDPTFNNTEEVG
jgi:Hemimethylated DNA-binding protein YccV like